MLTKVSNTIARASVAIAKYTPRNRSVRYPVPADQAADQGGDQEGTILGRIERLDQATEVYAPMAKKPALPKFT